MTRIYSATAYEPNPSRLVLNQDFDTEAEARQAIEACTEGRLVVFIRQPNLPNCLPAFVDKSVSMDVWVRGAWQSIDIHERSY